MNAQVTRALYEEPPRWSRIVVISCTIVAALLTFLIALPPLLSLVAPKSVTHPILSAPLPDRTDDADSPDQLSRSMPAMPTSPVGNTPTAPASSVDTTAEASPAVDSSAAGPPPSIAQEPPAPATSGRLTERAQALAMQSLLAPEPVFEVDTEPVAQPPLPRARPHQMTVAGIVGVPLPLPRPFIPTDAGATDRETSRQRIDPF